MPVGFYLFIYLILFSIFCRKAAQGGRLIMHAVNEFSIIGIILFPWRYLRDVWLLCESHR